MTARRYWLVKSEPEAFSWDDLWRAPKRTTSWEGVRNFQARNILRDEMKKGDGVLFYHSSTAVPAVMGLAEVVREGYPDPTAFDKKSDYYDPKSDPKSPSWFAVDLRAVEPLPRPVELPELRRTPGLEQMTLLKKGSRLSVQPVSAEEWRIITSLGKRT
ncbi:MAG TPA: EVE domain-containing protein [Gemmatimonadaceae bacterium]|nr:EVE domain-containing protein [Gemmatimonadaceae bacterium]